MKKVLADIKNVWYFCNIKRNNMKTTRQIKAYIKQCGHKRTNAEMAERLGVPRMTFAGVLANMKRYGEIDNNTLLSDLTPRTRSARNKTSK
jgi:predicted ArsR family transcriptional regulator